MLKKNLIANYLGQGWVALMGLAFIPQYVKYLGVEAYGMIGLYTVMTTWMNLLDMGVTPALSREMSGFTSGKKSAQSIRDLLRTVEFIIIGIALLIALNVGLASSWMASEWIRSDSLRPDVIDQAFVIMGFLVATRFSEGIYRSTLVGLQRQVLFNIVISLMATVRGIGSVMILAWLSPTIQAFFMFQALVAIATLLIMAKATYLVLPQTERSGRFSLEELRSVWKFASGMIAITFLGLMSAQIDKILISKVLPLEEFAHYSLASTVAGALYMLIGPITQAFYPKFCELYAGGNKVDLINSYHKSAQIISVIAGSAVILIFTYTRELLHLWGMDAEVVARIETIIKILVLGYFINGLTHIPYQMQLAHGWTSLAIRLMTVLTILSLLALLYIVPKYGIEGAAWIWVGIAIVYCIMSVEFMHKSILKNEKWRWYWGDVIAPFGAATLGVALVKWSLPLQGNVLYQVASYIFSVFVALVAGWVVSSDLRAALVQTMKRNKT